MFWRRRGVQATIKAIEGKDGYFFLHRDSNEVMKQITGETKIAKEQVAAIEAAHEQRRRLCEKSGIAYRHVICPNKESVLTDKLPDGFVYEQFGPSYLRQFLSAAPTHPCFYDRHLLKDKAGAYFRLDSHWTEVGAFPYLKAAANHFGDDRASQRLNGLGTAPSPIDYLGDIGISLRRPAEQSVGLTATGASSTLVFDGGLMAEGNLRFQQSLEPVNKGMKALILHDSFMYFLFRFVSELYEETFFINTPDLDPRFLNQFKPDIVWFFQAERFLPRVPRNDVDFLALIKNSEKRKQLPKQNSAFLKKQWPEIFT